MDSKLKCVFEMPVDAGAATQEFNDASPNVNEEKTKRVGDGAKTSPKVNWIISTTTQLKIPKIRLKYVFADNFYAVCLLEV